MKKTAISFGILSGLIIILYSLAVFLLFGDFSKMTTADLAKVEMLGYLRYLILLLTIIFAIRYFKKQNGGTGSFKPLFLAGFYTALVIAILVGLMELVYIAFNPDFFDQYGALTSKSLQEKGASAAEIADQKKQMESMKWMLNPAAMGAFYFFETAILGTIMSAITALVARTRGERPQVAF
jgi:hypothetical protein